MPFATASGLPAMCTNSSSRMWMLARDSLLMPLMRAAFVPMMNATTSFATFTRQFVAFAVFTHSATALRTSAIASALACTNTE